MIFSWPGHHTLHLLGTGKTVTGVHIAYWFAVINRRNTPRERTTPAEEIPEKAPPQVLYCGPSNKSVDVVAGVIWNWYVKLERRCGDLFKKDKIIWSLSIVSFHLFRLECIFYCIGLRHSPRYLFGQCLEYDTKYVVFATYLISKNGLKRDKLFSYFFFFPRFLCGCFNLQSTWWESEA